MPTFLWSGRTTSGKEEAAEIEAETASEAKKILQARGWTNLRQYTNEITDFVHSQGRASNPDYPKITAKQRLQYHQGTAPGFWHQWLKSLGRSSLLIVVIVAGIFMDVQDHAGRVDYNRIGVYVVTLGGAVFLYPIVRWRVGRTKRLFVQLTEAKNWRRWEEVLRCADQFAVSKPEARVGISDYSIAQYRASALAGLGRVEEALAGYDAAAIAAKTPGWLAHVTRASIYGAAKQYDDALKCYYDALSEEPNKPTICLDAGKLMVQRFNYPAKAKELLMRAMKEQLSELERVHVPFLQSMIAFREKDYRSMDQNMREALAGFEQCASARKFYIFETSLLMCKGYLAVSSAALGRKEEARKFFAESEKYLRVIELTDVLSEYEALMGRPEVADSPHVNA